MTTYRDPTSGHDYEVCGDGESWRGCGNTGAERRGARVLPGGAWTEWFETPCSHCGRVCQDETMVGLPVRVLTSPRVAAPQSFPEIVADAEAYAGNLFREAIEAGAPLSFTEILARASGFAEVRYDQAVEAATAPPEVTYDGSRTMGLMRTQLVCDNGGQPEPDPDPDTTITVTMHETAARAVFELLMETETYIPLDPSNAGHYSLGDELQRLLMLAKLEEK